VKKRTDVSGKKLSKIEEVSKELKEELKRGDEHIDTMGGFLTHKRFDSHPKLSDDLERIIAKTFKIDVEATHKVLLENLVIAGTDLGDRGTITVHLNRAEDNARLAHQLYCVARADKEEWDARHEVVRGAMWTQATVALQREKDAGERRKQITDADVKTKCAELFPDEWQYTEARGMRVKLMVEHFKELVDCWRSRCATLRTLLETRR
jgi:hypothetical protein